MKRSALAGKLVVVGVTGGIAAYKAADLVRRLRERGADVRVYMTRSARAFVGPLTFAALSGHRVAVEATELGGDGDRATIDHVETGHRAALVVVAPATADFLARCAHGRADDALGALILATRAPLLVAPAMESNMWAHPATQANAAALVERGAVLVGPCEGELASGRSGVGRMASVDEIVRAAERLLARSGDLAGRRIVVTAGPTREPIDPVRAS